MWRSQSHELSQIRVGGATGTRVRFTLKTPPNPATVEKNIRFV